MNMAHIIWVVNTKFKLFKCNFEVFQTFGVQSFPIQQSQKQMLTFASQKWNDLVLIYNFLFINLYLYLIKSILYSKASRFQGFILKG